MSIIHIYFILMFSFDQSFKLNLLILELFTKRRRIINCLIKIPERIIDLLRLFEKFRSSENFRSSSDERIIRNQSKYSKCIVDKTSTIFIDIVTRKRRDMYAIGAVNLRFTCSRMPFPRRSFEPRLLRP